MPQTPTFLPSLGAQKPKAGVSKPVISPASETSGWAAQIDALMKSDPDAFKASSLGVVNPSAQAPPASTQPSNDSSDQSSAELSAAIDDAFYNATSGSKSVSTVSPAGNYIPSNGFNIDSPDNTNQTVFVSLNNGSGREVPLSFANAANLSDDELKKHNINRKDLTVTRVGEESLLNPVPLSDYITRVETAYNKANPVLGIHWNGISWDKAPIEIEKPWNEGIVPTLVRAAEGFLTPQNIAMTAAITVLTGGIGDAAVVSEDATEAAASAVADEMTETAAKSALEAGEKALEGASTAGKEGGELVSAAEDAEELGEPSGLSEVEETATKEAAKPKSFRLRRFEDMQAKARSLVKDAKSEFESDAGRPFNPNNAGDVQSLKAATRGKLLDAMGDDVRMAKGELRNWANTQILKYTDGAPSWALKIAAPALQRSISAYFAYQGAVGSIHSYEDALQLFAAGDDADARGALVSGSLSALMASFGAHGAYETPEYANVRPTVLIGSLDGKNGLDAATHATQGIQYATLTKAGRVLQKYKTLVHAASEVTKASTQTIRDAVTLKQEGLDDEIRATSQTDWDNRVKRWKSFRSGSRKLDKHSAAYLDRLSAAADFLRSDGARSPEFLAASTHVKNYLADVGEQLQSHGLIAHLLPKFMHHFYPSDFNDKDAISSYDFARANAGYASDPLKHRVYDDVFEALDNNMRPELDSADILKRYSEKVSDTVGRAAFLDTIRYSRDEDGRPAVLETPRLAVVRGLTNAGRVDSMADSDNYHDPLDPMHPVSGTVRGVSDFNNQRVRGNIIKGKKDEWYWVSNDYSEQPDLSRLRQVKAGIRFEEEAPSLEDMGDNAADSARNALLAEQRVKLSPHTAARYNAIFGDSNFQHPFLRGMDIAAKRAKESLFFESVFHAPTLLSRLGIVASGHPTTFFHLLGESIHKMRHWEDQRESAEDAVKHGLVLSSPHLRTGFREYVGYEGWGKLKDALSIIPESIFGPGKLMDSLKLSAWERLMDETKEGTIMSRDERASKLATMVNQRFGGLNYALLDRSPRTQAILRLTFLAPDFTEATFRDLFSSFSKDATDLGKEERQTRIAELRLSKPKAATGRLLKAAKLGVARVESGSHSELGQKFQALRSIVWNPVSRAHLYAALMESAIASAVTYTLSGTQGVEQSFALPPGSIVYKGHSYTLSTESNFLMHFLEDPRGWALWRTHPLFARSFLEAATGRNIQGSPRNIYQQMGDLVANVLPIGAQAVLPSKKEAGASWWEPLVRSAGVMQNNTLSPAGRMAQRLYYSSMGTDDKTQAQQAQSNAAKKFYAQYGPALAPGASPQERAAALKEMQKQVGEGLLDPAALHDALNPNEATPFDFYVSRLSVPQALQVWGQSTLTERSELYPTMQKKLLSLRKKYVKEVGINPNSEAALADGALLKNLEIQLNHRIINQPSLLLPPIVAEAPSGSVYFMTSDHAVVRVPTATSQQWWENHRSAVLVGSQDNPDNQE